MDPITIDLFTALMIGALGGIISGLIILIGMRGGKNMNKLILKIFFYYFVLFFLILLASMFYNNLLV